MHRLLLFGGASLEDEAGPVTGRASQRGRLALLAMLAVEHPRGLSRDALIACLWPENDADRGRHLLRDSIYVLRRTLGEDAVVAVGDDLRLNRQFLTCDLWEFREACDRADTAGVVAAYRGPFLAGVFLSRAAAFERWAETERGLLQREFARALEASAEQALAQGDVVAAARWWRRLAEQDPYSGRYALRLVEALAAAGETAAAMRQAEVHAALLREEFGVAPDAELRAAAERLRRERDVAVEEPGPADEAAGRQGADPTPLTAVAVATAPSAALPGVPHPRRSGRPRAWRHATVGSAIVVGIAGTLALGLRSNLGLTHWAELPRAGLRAGPPGPVSAGAAEAHPSIAVLPFIDLSPDGDHEYFSDGITEEIIATLARIGELRVISRTSSLRYRGSQASLTEIAGELGAAYILEGSVRRSADRVRITVQLIDPRVDDHLWAESYDRELTAGTLLEIQSEIAQQVAGLLRVEISPAARSRIGLATTTDRAAHDYYLRGREAMKGYSVEAYEWAISLFDRALELDPDFGLAEAYRGDAYGTLWRYTHRAEFRDSASASHHRVVRLHPELPEGHWLLGRDHLQRGRLAEAGRHLERALELDPQHPGALDDLAAIHRERGRLDLALPLARAAAELEPTLGGPAWRVFRTYVALGDLDGAERAYAKTLDFEPSPLREHAHPLRMHLHQAVLSLMRGDRGRVLEHLEAIRGLHAGPTVLQFVSETALHAGDLEMARRAYEERRAAVPDVWRTTLTGLAYTLREAGETGRSDALLHEAIGRARQLLADGDETAQPDVILAQAYAVLGRTDAALASLETAYARGWRDVYHARLDPRYETLRSEPRFERLLRRIEADLRAMRARLRAAAAEPQAAADRIHGGHARPPWGAALSPPA